MTEPWVTADVRVDHLGVTKDSVYTGMAKMGMAAHRAGRPWELKVPEADERVRREDAAETAKPPSKSGRR